MSYTSAQATNNIVIFIGPEHVIIKHITCYMFASPTSISDQNDNNDDVHVAACKRHMLLIAKESFTWPLYLFV